MEMFRLLCLLSEDGVIKGQYSTMGDTYVNWTRDDTITGDVYQKSYFDRMIERNQVNAYLKEKEEAVPYLEGNRTDISKTTFSLRRIESFYSYFLFVWTH